MVRTYPNQGLRQLASAVKSFDGRCSGLEAYDHKQDIAETLDEIDMGSNTEVRQEARKELPMLQMHLRLSEEVFRASH